MSHLDRFPKRDRNRRIEEQSETAFRKAISECEEFVLQEVDNYDYGTDFQIEASDAGAMTNVRVHVQLKGTGRKTSADGSVGLSIDRKNLNYLAMQPGSIIVCYHIPSQRLLVLRVDDVLREYEHKSNRRIDQTTVTVRFEDDFDQGFQRSLMEYVVACAKGARDHRLDIVTQPPEHISTYLTEGAIDLHVPADQKQAEEMLVELYDRGHDRAISHSFHKFRAILGSSTRKVMRAYMAEINLGVNGRECDKSRIAEGIEVIRSSLNDGELSPGSLLYCIGNGWLAIDEYEKARDAYHSALDFLERAGILDVAARCCKNLGTTMEKLNNRDAAHALYTRALELDPNLAEAHLAMALWYRRNDANLDRALGHLDAIVLSCGGPGILPLVQGWRAEILFKQGRFKEAFRDIHPLLSDGDKLTWVWPWCARLVATYGQTSIKAAQHSVQFWDIYLRRFADNLLAQRERLLCVYQIHANGGRTEYDYDAFKHTVADAAANGAPNAAFLWDRAGHWAQDENDWSEAESCYRKAFELAPTEYGYCLGTALNFLGMHEEALPILLPQAIDHQPDAMSCFQVAVAREGTGDVEGCINAYKRSLQLDENYDLAWFNLGGIYWNSQNKAHAMAT